MGMYKEKQTEKESNKSYLYGVVPLDFPDTKFRGMRVYSESFWQSIQDQITAEKRLKELMQNFKLNNKHLIEKARAISYITKDGLLKCVESGFKAQLKVKYPGYSCGLDCGVYYDSMHRSKYFMDWLRSPSIMQREIDLCCNTFFLAIPDELNELLRS